MRGILWLNGGFPHSSSDAENISMSLHCHSVRSGYNMLNVFQNDNEKHPTVCKLGVSFMSPIFYLASQWPCSMQYTFIMDHTQDPTVHIAVEYHQYQMRSPWLRLCILDSINECIFALRDMYNDVIWRAPSKFELQVNVIKNVNIGIPLAKAYFQNCICLCIPCYSVALLWHR